MTTTFKKGDTVQLADSYRGLDKRNVLREYQPGDLFKVLAHVPGEPEVRVRDARDVSTVLIPAKSLRRVS